MAAKSDTKKVIISGAAPECEKVSLHHDCLANKSLSDIDRIAKRSGFVAGAKLSSLDNHGLHETLFALTRRAILFESKKAEEVEAQEQEELKLQEEQIEADRNEWEILEEHECDADQARPQEFSLEGAELILS